MEARTFFEKLIKKSGNFFLKNKYIYIFFLKMVENNLFHGYFI